LAVHQQSVHPSMLVLWLLFDPLWVLPVPVVHLCKMLCRLALKSISIFSSYGSQLKSLVLNNKVKEFSDRGRMFFELAVFINLRNFFGTRPGCYY